MRRRAAVTASAAFFDASVPAAVSVQRPRATGPEQREVVLAETLLRLEERANAFGLPGVAHKIQIARTSHEPEVIHVREESLRGHARHPRQVTGEDLTRAVLLYTLAADAVAAFRRGEG